MKPVCKFYKNSECLNENCRFSHPKEFPMYIYTFPGVEIHPDELRLAVCSDPAMAVMADNAWIENYTLFCRDPSDKEVDVLQYPDYFCQPFDPARVSAELDKIDLQPVKQEAYQSNYKGNFGSRSFSPNQFGTGQSTGYKNYNKGWQQPREYQGRTEPPRNDNYQRNSYQGRSDFQGRDNYQNRNQGNRFNNTGNKFQGSSNEGNFGMNKYNQGPSNFQPGMNRFNNTQQDGRNSTSGGYQDNRSKTSEYPNGFDRKSNTPGEFTDDQQDYDYHQVPYTYK